MLARSLMERVRLETDWCGPCRGFTPTLIQAYDSITRLQRKKLEIVFVSADRTAGEFREYYASMPWAAVPFDDEARRDALNAHYGVRGIPTLILIAPDGTVICKNARAEVEKDAQGANFPWGVVPSTLASATSGQTVSLADALAEVRRSADSPDAAAATLRTLVTIAANIIASPHEEKYRRLRTDNKAVRVKVLDVPGGVACLYALGFVLVGDYYVLEPSGGAWDVLVHSKERIEAALTLVGGPAPMPSAGAQRAGATSGGAPVNAFQLQELVAALAANPSAAHEAVASDPMLQALVASNPEAQRMLADPALLQNMLAMLGSNPALMGDALAAAQQNPELFAAVNGALAPGAARAPAPAPPRP